MEAIQHQMPQTNAAGLDTTTPTPPMMGPLVVVKSGLLQTAPFPGDIDSQIQAGEYLTETARISTNPSTTSTLVEPATSAAWSDTFDEDSGQLLLTKPSLMLKLPYPQHAHYMFQTIRNRSIWMLMKKMAL